MLARDLRLKYLEFFQSKGHLRMPGAPLVPIDALGEEDTTTLFSGSGMEQFKPYFAGHATPPNRRICTVQKCLRTNDIDSVGDFSHCTFFEMLGNFSFGDYFKAEVIPWTWEFLTQWVGIDPDRLCVTVFTDDEEAFEIWHNVIGLPEDRIHRLGEKHNYWPANAITDGPDGVCGPCSEIYYRMPPIEEMTAEPALSPAERFIVDDAAGRWLEIWNNVFTQFRRGQDDDGRVTLTPLPQKNNDTGAGLDRIAVVMQNKNSVFETDLFLPILEKIVAMTGEPYRGSNSPEDFAFRLIAEHARSSVFIIGDGITPDKAGRGYVLRYILRRAIRYGKTVLGFNEPFMHELAPVVIEQMGDFYPELVERRDLILHTIHEEEEQFRRTLDNGMARLTRMLDSGDVQAAGTLSGADVFTLYDTYGFPPKVTEEIARERGVRADMGAFESEMEQQRSRSRERSDMGREVFSAHGVPVVELAEPVEFLGYGQLATPDARVEAILVNGERVETARPGETVRVVLNRTPFYAESGGQVGDTGELIGTGTGTTCAVRVRITGTQRAAGVITHTGTVEEGELAVGQTVSALVDAARRRHIMRNHTATHLLQAVLREELGPHVHQKGSLVAPDRLRFDFTHAQPLSPEQIRTIEEKINTRILEGSEVTVHVDVPIAAARARGAMALFGEKYGDLVRMVEVPGVSLELCGGTHVANTAAIGLLKIVSETGVAAGVRRMEAVTGEGAYQLIVRREQTAAEACRLLKSTLPDLPASVEKLQSRILEQERVIRELRSGTAASTEVTPVDVRGACVIAARLDNADQQAAAHFVDQLAARYPSSIIVVGTPGDGKVAFTAKVSRDLVDRGANAGLLVREVAKMTGGGGGGRPDFATAGGKDPSRLAEALDAVPGLVELQLA